MTTSTFSPVHFAQKLCVSICSISLIVSCTPVLTPAAQDVRLAKKAHSNCQELGLVYGEGGGGTYTSAQTKLEHAQIELRNETAELGGNLVVMDAANSDLNGTSISGRAFKCGEDPGVPVQVVAQEQEASSGDSPSQKERTPEERLSQLKELLDKGAITQEEYDEKREAILDSI